MPFIATPIEVSVQVENILEGIAKSRTRPLNQIQRAQIILGANKGKSNQKMADEIGLNRDSISKWRIRWAENAAIIKNTEQSDPQNLEKVVESVLQDSQRPGSPCSFTEEQILQILEIACRNPAEFGYETSHWSLPQLAKAVTDLGIVDSISPASVGRFLKYGKHSTAQGKILASFNRQGR